MEFTSRITPLFLCFLLCFSTINAQNTFQQGQDLFDKKAEATTFEELLLINNTNVTLEGIEPVNGSDAYIIKNGFTRMYYDLKSGLKVAENTQVGEGDKKMTVTKNFSDYRDVKGIKIPFNLIVNQGFELDIKMRYSHKKPLINTKINTSDINPKTNKERVLVQVNEVCVMG